MKRIIALDCFILGACGKTFGTWYPLYSFLLLGCATAFLHFGESIARHSVRRIPGVTDEIWGLILVGIAAFVPWCIECDFQINGKDVSSPSFLSRPLRFIFVLGFIPWYTYLVYCAAAAFPGVNVYSWLYFVMAPFFQLAAMYAMASRTHLEECCAG